MSISVGSRDIGTQGCISRVIDITTDQISTNANPYKLSTAPTVLHLLRQAAIKNYHTPSFGSCSMGVLLGDDATSAARRN